MIESRACQERKRRGWSLTRLTVETGINTSSLSLVERGKLPAYPAWRKKIAEAYGMAADDLFDGETVKPGDSQ